MSYGFKVVNDDHIVQIDESYPVLQLGEFGSGGANVDVYFSRPYTTSAPPWLFIRSAGGYFLIGLRFLGGPGAWTGYRMHATDDIYHNHGLAGRGAGTWQYMVGEWAVKPSNQQMGMRIWDGSGVLLYDAGVQHINLMYQFQSWTYRTRKTDNSYYFYEHQLDLPPAASLADPNNYLLINPLMRERFNIPGDDGTSFRKIGPFTSSTILHVTRSRTGNFSLPYIHPGIIGRASL